MNGEHQELLSLLEGMCEEALSSDQMDRLEELVLRDQNSRRVYLAYMDLHGSLYWDAAQRGYSPGSTSISTASETTSPDVSVRSSRPGSFLDSRLSWKLIATASLAVCLLLAAGIMLFAPQTSPSDLAPNLAETPDADQTFPSPDQNDPSRPIPGLKPIPIPRNNPQPSRPPLIAQRPPEVIFPEKNPLPNPPGDPANPLQPWNTGTLPVEGSLVSTVNFINDQIQSGWLASGVMPSPRADDAEWMRRLSLDLTGEIPSANEVLRFTKDRDPQKRMKLIEKYLDETAYVHHMTTVWTNLLIGRADNPNVNRPALQQYLRNAFGRNQPWDQTVQELISAEGDFEENGAVNFMLAHLNNEAVPATAITARVFLGMQIQCTQCHDHPFNDWKQNQFWEFNSFFKQTDLAQTRKVNELTGDETLVTELISHEDREGPIYYETRKGLIRAAFPQYEGIRISSEQGVNRREALANLVIQGENPQVARAIVNRMWAHFFGRGFTHPIDDMGPHNPTSHPLLLERLSRDFVLSGYDIKQLIRWICYSDAYQLTSRFNPGNGIDDPEMGETPLFSRVYLKTMTAEQVYDALLKASGRNDWTAGEWVSYSQHRTDWLQQFVHDYETEENDESTVFDGTITQALTLMNGPLIEQATSLEPGTFLYRIVTSKSTLDEKVHQVALATLSRNATPEEVHAVRELVREKLAQQRNRNISDPQLALGSALQDLMWAYLNSSEFVLIH